jgi:hypothetical protein
MRDPNLEFPLLRRLIRELVAAVVGVDAEGRSLEDIATPLSLQRSGSPLLATRGASPATST